MRLTAGLCSDPLRELERSPRPLSRNRGRVLLLRGREGSGGEEEGKGKREVAGVDAIVKSSSI